MSGAPVGARGLLVAADDRTGALETAAALADAGTGPVPVGVDRSDAAVQVVDLGSRHLTADRAARRAAAFEAGLPAGVPTAHKIDSVLRGRWAHELVARHGEAGRRVLVVPALPSLGRRCVGGVVHADGRPVHEGPAGRDPRDPVTSSRPADHLLAAGAPDVTEVAGPRELDDWLASASPFAVADAMAGFELRAIGRWWAQHAGTVVLASSSEGIAAAAAALVPAPVRPAQAEVPLPVLVVCGSLHPAARRQVARLVAAAPAGVEVLVSPATDGPIDGTDADRTAKELAAAVHARTGTVEAVVVIGGDTAAAVIGDRTVVVHGSLAPGSAWGRLQPEGTFLVTRSGGFGDDLALVGLVGSGRIGT